MDAQAPPQIVFEQPAPCEDADAAAEVLRQSLDDRALPKGAWTIRMRVLRREHGLVGHGEVEDAEGRRVAERSVESSSLGCRGVARAIGVWAQLVLDAEAERPRLEPRPASPAQPPDVASEPSAMPRETDPRTFDIGATSFAMWGTGAGVLAGGSAFVDIGAGAGWFLRPAFNAGGTASAAAGDWRGVYGAIRLDACARKELPWGLRFVPCLGTEIGLQSYRTPPRAVRTGLEPSLLLISIGPSVALSARLAAQLTLEARGSVAFDTAPLFLDPTELVAPSFLIARGELGIAWHVSP